MSLELDNISEPNNEDTKPQDLDKFGVWIQNSSQDNFTDSFDIPAASAADGFESASFSDLSDFDTDKNNSEDWNFDLSEFDIPDPPELSGSDTTSDTSSETNDELPLEAAMSDAEAFASTEDNAEQSGSAETDSFVADDSAITGEAATDFELGDMPIEERAPEAAAEPVETPNEDPSIDGFLPSAATNDIDISDFSDFDFGDDSSFPVPDSITGQTYIEETAEKTTPEAVEEEEAPVAEPFEDNIDVTGAFEQPAPVQAEEPAAAQKAEPEPETPKKPIAGYDEVSLDDLSTDIPELLSTPEADTIAQPKEEVSASSDAETEEFVAAGEETFGDIEFEDITAAIPIEAKAAPKAEEIDEVAEAIFNTETEEIDIDSFLSDSPAPSMGGTEEISLEDFMSDSDFSEASEFKEFMTTSSAPEKSDILNDPPIDMSLTFDDSFVLEENESSDTSSEAEIPIDDFVSDIVTTGEETFDNFDDIFDNITDMNAPEIPDIPDEQPKVESDVSFDEVSEFDDLLNSFEDSSNKGTTEIPDVVPVTKTAKKVDFDIQVNLDESEIKHETIETTNDSEEDVAVSLFTDKGSSALAAGGAAMAAAASTFSMADIDDSITFVDETPDAPASSIIDDLSFEGVEIVDISDKPNENNPIEAEPIQNEAAEVVQPSIKPSDFVEESEGFDFPEIDDELFEKAVAVGAKPETQADVTENVPEDEPNSDMSFDDLPDIDDIFDTAEQETSGTTDELPSLDDIPDEAIVGSGIAAGVVGAGIAAAMTADEETPVVEESPVVEDASVAEEETPVVEDEIPVSTEDFGIVEDAPVIEETPVIEEEIPVSTDDFGITEETPIVEEEIPVSTDEITFPEETPVEEESVVEEVSVTDDMPSMDDFNFTDESTVFDEEPIVEETPVVDETPAVEDFGAVEETPIVEETPVVEDEIPVSTEDFGITEEEPIIEETPVTEEEIPVSTDEITFPEETPVEEEPVVEEASVTDDMPSMDDFNFTEEATVIEEEPVIEETPVVDETPVVEDFGAVEETPIVEETPVVEDFSAVEDAPVIEETQVADEEIPVSTDEITFPEETPVEEEPVVEAASVTDDMPSMDDFNFTDETPVIEEPVAEETPVVEEFGVFVKETPVVDETPVVEDFGAVEETPVVEEEIPVPTEDFSIIEETPVVDETPVVEDFGAFEETPIVEETPVVENEIPVSTEDFGITEETPVIEETPVADEEIPVSTDEITFPEETPVEEESVIEEAPVSVEPEIDIPVTEDFSLPEEPVAEETPVSTEDFALSEEEPVTEETPAPLPEETPSVAAIGMGVLGAGVLAASAALSDVSEDEPSDSSESNELNTTNELDVVENCIYNDNQGDMEVISDMNDFDINNTDSVDNSAENPVLDKIVNELSSLRNEMASIKAELDMLKKSDGSADSADDIKIPNAEAEESTGFFSGDEDDETIALSGDELNNILNSAAFTEETAEAETTNETAESEEPQTPSFDDTPEEPEAPAEMPVSEDDSLTYDDGEGPDTSIDFNENVSEPVIDDINFDIDNEENQAPAELPDEIEIPSSEDSFVVDAASPHDFLEDNDPTLDEALSSDKVSYLNEDSLDNVTFGEANEEAADDFAPETFGSSVEPPVGEDIDDTPAESVFDGEQWKPEPEAAPSFDAEPAEEPVAEAETPVASDVASMPDNLKNDVKSVLAYMDQLLENLPEEKIAEFARSEHFEVYKKLFTELGLA